MFLAFLRDILAYFTKNSGKFSIFMMNITKKSENIDNFINYSDVFIRKKIKKIVKKM
jgi:hypothetical protein